MQVTINNQTFTLHFTGAVFWHEQNVLLISDLHLGKVSHFRKHGVAIPKNAVTKNFSQLDFAVAFFNPGKVIFLGDLFHSAINSEWELFQGWMLSTSIEITLIAGNHDIISQNFYTDIGVQVFNEIVAEGFLLTHYPEVREGFFNFCGHIHPAVNIYGKGRQSIKLPCFFQKEHQMILPAFGEFTGTFVINPSENDNIYVIAKKEVMLISKV
ncbi:ligase-associated DNA damage response endonuclease PdeM [Flavobacterium sp. GT3R68]|uniref:ligase-associated DNA damage response endonuclease PdeM n=1 Tax=Flavobacterium sp. GT3R68 TaxID=2594437 RepID=UPI000F85D136|nr:ligase-associated DNA damage response endonuclease PdeM [Flavobacterium sp. GT3R68]RTY87525.1 ligase-associated DNA damage response endonuclease PdeM [Flavobacterium sp. GSN2]TRW90436.1 ligase-associated DNA damage response endonuclease PdeM [Flavobacterium sp. GT3R68]